MVRIIFGNYKNNYDIATKTAQWALTPKQLNLVLSLILTSVSSKLEWARVYWFRRGWVKIAAGHLGHDITSRKNIFFCEMIVHILYVILFWYINIASFGPTWSALLEILQSCNLDHDYRNNCVKHWTFWGYCM